VAKILANQLFEDEVKNKASEKYSGEKTKEGKERRWGCIPCSIKVGKEKSKVTVSRLYDNEEGKTIGLKSYQKMNQIPLPSVELIKKIIIGLRKAIEKVFGEFNLTQRCPWHKRENVVSYLRDEEKDIYTGKLQRAYS
jgi:predicted FMN-binding regulatory protein PaiB